MHSVSRLAVAAFWLAVVPVVAMAHAIQVAPQPMVATGLVAGHQFEAWFVLDRPLDPTVPGYAVPAGATIRFVFPDNFKPDQSLPLQSVLLYGWPQKGIPVPFTVRIDPQNAQVVVLHLASAIEVKPPLQPGLKAIHLRAPLQSPVTAGSYPIVVTFADAGDLSGHETAVAAIAAAPAPAVAVYNQLHDGRDEDFQRVAAGAAVPIPFDFLVSNPGSYRATVVTETAPDGTIQILADERSIGTVRAERKNVTLIPVPFGPGYNRLGIFRLAAKAGEENGTVRVVASLKGGSTCFLTLIIE